MIDYKGYKFQNFILFAFERERTYAKRSDGGAISQKMGHRHHFFIVTELLHVAYQNIATYQ